MRPALMSFRLLGCIGVTLIPALVHFTLATGWCPLPEACGGWARSTLIFVPALSHAVLYGGLLLLFTESLRQGHEDLVTALAARVDGPLNPAMASYTRGVTKAWSLFFAGQLVVSAALGLLAPLATWSLFVNVLDVPLVVAMFAAEYGFRRYRFRNYPHVSLARTIAAFKNRADSHRARRDTR